MEYVLRTNTLSKSYHGINVVNKVSMNVAKGDIYGFIGKNGAGKTTLMKLVCGLAKETIGEMELFGSQDLAKGRKRIGCVIEQPALYPGMTARENLCYYNIILGITDNSNIEEVLQLVGLEETGKKKTKNFSLGMKQRLSIAISLLGSPDFLILDEPINGLDPSGIKEVRELLLQLREEKNITILISSHILGELSRIATKYGIIDQGILVDEFTTEELNLRCKKCLKIVVDDAKKATYIIANTFGSREYKVIENNTLCIFDCIDNPGIINTELIKNGVTVESIGISGQDLEAHFMEIMGGMIHA